MNFLQYLLAAMATAPSEEAETSLEIGKDLVEGIGEITETAAETAAELSFEPSRLVEMLPYMGVGMFIIFVLIGVIILVTVLTNKIFTGNQK